MSLLCLKITTMNMTMLAMLMAMNMAMLTRLFTGVYTYHQFDNWIASAGMDNMIIWMMIGCHDDEDDVNYMICKLDICNIDNILSEADISAKMLLKILTC